MKPILYSASETAFDSNGIGVLADAIECRVVQELNGQYELTLRYPITGIHYKDIVRRAIILAKPDPVSAPQPFRIYRKVPTSQGTITAYARHIAYDLIGNVVSPFSATGAANALQALKDNSVTDCPFTFWTNKVVDAAMTVAVPTSVWSLLGGSEGSVLDVFGGEYEFDRFAVKLWTRRGEDRGVSIRYGKNLTSFEQDENIANCYTGVYPFWSTSDGSIVQLPEKVVHAPGTYDHVRIMPLDLSQDWQEAPSENQLRERAERYMADNEIGTPAVSWKVQHVDLEQTEEYKGSSLLERVLLGDTVSVEFADICISSSARVVATDFNVLLDRYNNITLGTVKANLAATIAHQSKELQQKPSKAYVKACTDALDASLTPDEVFNRLTNYGAVQGIYIQDDKLYINAELAKILNLVTEKLVSEAEGSRVDIDGAAIRFFGNGYVTCEIYNWADGLCRMLFYTSDNGVEDCATIGADRIGVGGDKNNPDASIVARSVHGCGSRLYIDEILWASSDAKTPFKLLGKRVEWQDNGDGSSTLIGL